ncbi:MAG: transposase [Gammaproteobacteria bacterium]
MTKVSMPLKELFEKGAKADFVREMIQFMAQWMEVDVEGLCGVVHAKRSEERNSYHYSSLERRWDTRAKSTPMKVAKLRGLMDEAEPDLLSYLDFPREHRTMLQSTDTLERLSSKVERRSDVIGTFRNKVAIIPLVGALLLEQSDDWAIHRRYIWLETLATVAENGSVRLAATAS